MSIMKIKHFRKFLLSCVEDLDAALPIIEKYKDQLAAVGEVKIQCFLAFVTQTASIPPLLIWHLHV